MGFMDEMKIEEVKQQIKLLKRKNALRILKHVPGRAAMIEFEYDANLFGNVVVKGDKYKIFKEAGGFDKLKEEELLEEEDEQMSPSASQPKHKRPEPEPVTPAKSEVKTDGTKEQGGEDTGTPAKREK
jgi:hypothetical protein